MAYFALEIRFDRDNERRLAVRPAHREYTARLHAEGRVVMAGPWADGTGAMLVYSVQDASELERILADDPYALAGVITRVSVREWTPVLVPPAP